ncbi:uncharacterized protein LOC132726336 [Ruditapes philippinarum]|uniref:uncharacterized protein LOC132726336 n=1 Tax=Ruditapes philippinarum TaxID=129788 RepID=UPI00295B8A7E|nr:uncharacterized protein LOC132726336 [Ruditapes philippinarum]
MQDVEKYGNDYHDDDDSKYKDDETCPECKDDGIRCGFGEIFCIEAMRCVTENGYCPLPDCGSSQKVCYIDGGFQCAPSCLYAKFIISMDGNFFDIVGRNYENYNSVKNTLTQQLAAALGVEQNDIIETYLWNGK